MTNNIHMITLKSGHKIWTRASQQGSIPVLLLHGGPGSTHEYLECFEKFLPQHGYQVIFYDQLGSYRSDKPQDKSLWTLERFTEEIEEVRQGLGLDKIFLFGFSWGGMLSIEYALKYPEHLLGMITSGMTASMADYEERMANLRHKLPAEVQEKIRHFEQTHDIKNPEYKKLVHEWIYQKNYCRLDPWPASLPQSFDHCNREIYTYMWGNNDFCVEGTLKTWNRWDELNQLSMPILLMGGEHDVIDPHDLRCMAQGIKDAEVFISQIGSHFAFYEDQENYFKALIGFLDKTMRKQAAGK